MMKRTIRQNVEEILRKYEQARGDDKFLLLAYWKEIDGIDFSNFEHEFMTKGTMAESIRRQRQLIQEEGKYLPSEEIIEARRERQRAMRASIKNKRIAI
jgi:hypothetical protein